jgi:serine/threonine-protein kinase HipA
MPMAAIEEQFRRMVFNIVARNQDDHVKNIAFLMDRAGQWTLSPAYDVTYSYNLQGAWTSAHQMTLNGKRDNFEAEDFRACAESVSMMRGRAGEILDEVRDVISQWRDYAQRAGVPGDTAQRIAKAHRLSIN